MIIVTLLKSNTSKVYFSLKKKMYQAVHSAFVHFFVSMLLYFHKLF